MKRVRILYVDDEPSHLWIFRTTFESEFDILTATSGAEAIELFKKESGIGIVLSDQRMPGMSGVEFMAAIFEIDPAPIRMLVTGYSDLEEIINAINVGHIFQYILKPWNVEALASSLHHARDIYRLTLENRELTDALAARNLELSQLNRRLNETNVKLALDIKKRRKVETELRRSREQISELTREIMRAQEGERRRIALDLHDNVAQDLSSLKFLLESMAGDLQERPDIDLPRRQVIGLLQECIKSVRDLSHDLLPPSLAVLGLADAIEQYCRESADAAGIGFLFREHGVRGLDIPYETAINLYRLTQEAVSNVRRHAGAGRLEVDLRRERGNISLCLTDNGSGFDPDSRTAEAAREKRMGLRSMEERVGLLGGELTIESSPGRGTRVMVVTPVSV